jgi:hypothetical protein
MLLNVVAMAAMSSWEGPGVTYGSAPNTAPVGSYGNTGGWQIGQGGGSLNTISSGGSINPQGFHFTKMTSFSSLTAMDYANIAFNVITGINTVALFNVEKMNKQLAQDKIDFKAYTEKTAIEDAGYQILEPLISSIDLTQIMRATNRGGALGGEKYFALYNAQYEVPYTSWAFSETINNKVTNNYMYV